MPTSLKNTQVLIITMTNIVEKEKNVFQIEREGEMLVPGIILASKGLFEAIKQDKTIEQVKNVACLPGIIRKSLAMADAHWGYGFPIGGVAAFDKEKGVISPGGVGYDINCGVRLLLTNLTRKDVEGKNGIITKKLYEAVPSGVGEKGRIKLTDEELNEVMIGGAQWAVRKGYGEEGDCENIEDGGKLEKVRVEKISPRARARGRPQLGSLGAGNHFLELQYVDEVFDEEVAKKFGIEKGQVTIMIHCGSRGLGHQVASDYIQRMEKEYSWPKQDRQLTNAPINSELGREYFSSMCAAANFAYANRQIITHWVRGAMKELFPKFQARVLYDVCHNIAKFEKHKINGEEKEVLIMRKGATRALGPGREELSKKYKKTGQPVIIPGSMGTASYVLVGTKKAEELSWSSTAHGAGRIKSRTQAKKEMNAKQIIKELADKGIVIKSGSMKGIVEEAPQVYKDIEEVAQVSHDLGIARKVARVRPIGVVKG